jgi:hypothetical protein
MASGLRRLQRGMIEEYYGATMRAGMVTSMLTKKWVTTDGKKEGGKRVVSMANHWVMVAVLECPHS